MEETTLYYRQGASDKVYRASLEGKDGGFVVNITYGRRGSAMNTGTKTRTPVDYETAKGIYDKLVRQKMAKGYTPGEDGTRYRHTEYEGRDAGICCQLLHAIDEETAKPLLSDPLYCLQEKFDGRRLLIRKEGETVEGINRKGLITGFPESVCQAVREQVPGDCILDGECVGEQYVVFDVLRSDGADLRSHPYSYRLAVLYALLPFEEGDAPLRRIDTVVETPGKEAMFRMLRDAAEGVVLKKLDALYQPGRETHRDQFKFKFVQSATFVVGDPMIGNKRSVPLILFRNSVPVSSGNVTIPPNHEVPRMGAVVEVRYLYAFRESGCVYQPVYLGERDDIPTCDCTPDQLKYKPEVEQSLPA